MYHITRTLDLLLQLVGLGSTLRQIVLYFREMSVFVVELALVFDEMLSNFALQLLLLVLVRQDLLLGVRDLLQVAVESRLDFDVEFRLLQLVFAQSDGSRIK